MFKSDERKKVTCITHNMQNFQNVNSRKVIRIEHIQTQQEYLNKPSNLEKSPWGLSGLHHLQIKLN